ncbi:MAG: cupin domain-containing protein [Xanthomonadales bacterium]|nr:cupin domain-containing protein [Xanthomonadales bacterium]
MSRQADFASDDGLASFWFTGPYEGGNTWVGRFSAESPWERHPGDEFLYVVEGSVRILLLIQEEPTELNLSEGCHFVVPKNTWHRQIARGTVVEIGATPGKTDHSDLADPRAPETSD